MDIWLLARIFWNNFGVHLRRFHWQMCYVQRLLGFLELLVAPLLTNGHLFL